ncbi:hypothetical protein SLEP1_g2983 [Rubroshorea leprosula]|uniref:Cupin type-1 domain-containing protein n=1 Tax=Rubroshorea leprosula TaxID=152421 RepID=A0AAV5HR80_9ROSI|nr:hypothetical protein SLEP1_g2983 [Rubroshorea leprosula]
MMILLLPLLSHSTDPDLLLDFRAGDLAAAAAAAPSLNGFPCKPTSAVTSDGFFFDALTKEGNMSNISGSAVNSANVLTRKVLVGLVTTGNEYYSKVLGPWQMFVIPRGLHFQLNVGKGKALAITTFSSQLPGSLPLSKTIFASDPSIPEQFLNNS